MAQSVFTTIVEQLAEFKDGLKYVGLFGNGEPLLDKSLEKRIAQCKELGLENVGFTTNASLMTEERAANLISAEPDWIVVSFDSLNKEVYESIRLRLKFDVVLNGILALIQARNAHNSKTRIVLRFVQQSKNETELNDYFDFWEPKLNPSLDEVSYARVHNWALGPQVDQGNSPCGFVFSRAYILRDGTMVLCCVDSNAEYDFGNVKDSSLLDLWNGPRWEMIREYHANNKRSTLNLCNACNLPELHGDGVRMTPSGNVFSTDTTTPFDYETSRSQQTDVSPLLLQPRGSLSEE
jgi:sulfatase maturation enzyme AslB (radical SAM superfamily)